KGRTLVSSFTASGIKQQWASAPSAKLRPKHQEQTEMSGLENSDAKVAIITGGTFGIGKAITLTLAERGFRVVSFGLDSPQPSTLAADGIAPLRTELAKRGLTGEVMEADVAVAADVDKVVAHALATYGRIDALVNNAAIG